MSSVCGVEDADVGALGVELALAHVLPAGEERVRAVHGEGVGRDRERVLAHGAEVEHQADAGRVGRLAARAGTARTRETRRLVRSTPVGLAR